MISEGWGGRFYTDMDAKLSWCYRHRVVNEHTKQPISYRELNINDGSGALRRIWQETMLVTALDEKEQFVEYPIEVWTEKDAAYQSVSSLFGWDAEAGKPKKYRLNLVSCKGWAKTQEVEKLLLDRPDTKVILYLTDFDPAGYYMTYEEFSLGKILHTYFNRRDIHIKRIGIVPDQIPEERRHTSANSFSMHGKLNRRFQEEFGEKYPLVMQGLGYELQALNPSELRTLVSKAIDSTVKEYGFERIESGEDW